MVNPRVVRILGAALLALAPHCGQSSTGDVIRSLTILHTNDLHARISPDGDGRGGFAYLATAIRRECAASDGCLVLDGGDLVQGTPVSSIYRGLPVFELANLLGLDASTLGNHEFDYGWERIPEFLNAANFPIVTANVVDERGRLLGGTPWVVLESNGVRVGIIGVLTAELDSLIGANLAGPWKVLPVVEAVERYLPQVRPRSDLVVVVGHLVDEEETALLSEIPEVAAVVAGHGHAGLAKPNVVDGRPVVRVQANGRQLGRLDLTVDLEKNTVTDWTWKAVPVDAKRIDPDARVAREVALWEARVADVVDVPIGISRRRLSHGEVRLLLERAMVDVLDADLAYVNRGGVRDILPEGPLTARHIWNIMPFDNHVVVGRFEADELPAFLVEERTLEAGRTYRLATIDFVATKWNERRRTELVFSGSGPLLRDLVIGWIRERKVVSGQAMEES